jgi:hypothetical protein
MIFLGTLLAAMQAARVLMNFARFNSIPCEYCGAIISRGGTTAPLLCSRCRLRHLPSKQAKKEVSKGIFVLLALLLMVGMIPGLMFGNFVGSRLGLSYQIAVPLIAVATVVVAVAVHFAVFVLRFRRLGSEPFVLKLAGKAAGEDGEVVKSGATTVWYSGPTNPSPLLMEQMESTRSGLESLMGRKIGSPPFLRILCFRKRSGFEAFVRPFTAHVSHFMRTVDGLYFPQRVRIATLCEEELPHHVSDQAKTARSLFCLCFLEALPGSSLANWAKEGISKSLTAAVDDLARLNRKMLASLSRGTVFGARLFEINDQDILKPMKSWDDHHNFEKMDQFQAEAWSVFEYLGGTQAPESRRECLRAFLADKRAKARPAKVFERHFGFGLDRLVESWQQWVQEQGIGTFAPLPPHIEEALRNRLIPLVENREANREDRILAVRHMGSQGYVLAGGALIGLLGHDDAIPRDEIIWALEAISGMASSDDPDRWAAWWVMLPAEVRSNHSISKPLTLV